jgi:hypothetical protein
MEGVVSMGLIVVLLVLWLVFIVVGFVVKTLIWLAVIGIVLFFCYRHLRGDPRSCQSEVSSGLICHTSTVT